MRMRKKKNLPARLERCAAYLVASPEEHRGRWRDLSPRAEELRLELGCGKGRFTCQTAALHPEVLFIAVERIPDVLITAMELARDMGLSNVLFICAEASKLETYFAPDEVDLLYINFCDPWPANQHARRRLTHPGFLEKYRAVLRAGGIIEFKTDNMLLFEWSLFQFPKAHYRLLEVKRDLHAGGVNGIMTDYEEKFHQLGIPINRCVACKESPLPPEEPEHRPSEMG
ncbi:tRNA (guanine-N(7)-)-methyltransferase [bioreactor metagenome]|uniref:tRNA (guanine(46)-N(7))-methyltransferase n=1 Tax=bioreactor metagenome TaxID=1076179 RepID=A0A644Z8A3_9ZZZZ